MKKKRAFLKWAGGKYPLVDEIKKHLPQGNCLIEPFVGAGSVFLNTNYDSYVLADINSDLINLYNTVKYRSEAFIEEAQRLFTPEFNTSEQYYLMRKTFNQSDDPAKRSILFLYLNRHCYNGLCRYNLRGEFNVPFGRYKKPYFPKDELLWFAEKAQKATFVTQSYSKTLLDAPMGSVIYCDPPYAPLSETANFTAYHTNAFSAQEQQNLALLAHKLSSEREIPVLISNHETPMTREWYHQAQLHIVKVRRTISRNILNRAKVNELLALYAGASKK
ncbi:TPA: adenine-specific DNA-methyltransferase [Providencia alcalifaciens]|uniref:Site-specific DNA-methyltransferase (adenine-specific) n=1 Tax=Providencia alcalifaciens TaxID=126385 RepID=A0AAW9V9X7_9GAMM|nr:adenine-specific DNA-methyltransferase [Providencia alcalifaciens]EUD04940.1 DNA adenine methylase Dam [Providencia alcalifaciens RIMD 1656011]MBF0693218.1 adenine-specific DNA-methyltransferase [Providencia alcalifaciens]MTC34624.1 adenine-specific DNA-methyltransferase [Providencia alcalifaciens]MTC39168.1 adenine-specific DNA-methyltransferase [Providencia alcalifaciens]NYS91722.1 adenine-specific DNA-methyltransferase [Providencia alcalifaciens]